MDAFLQMPVSDAIRITRLSALVSLAPATALLVAAIMIFVDTLLYAFHLDRSMLWLEAIKWALRGWKAMLAWVLAFCAAFLLAVNYEQPVALWISAALGVLLLCLLPFVAWNESNIEAKKPILSSKPQWPGAKPILYAATFIAIAFPLAVYYAFATEYLLHPAVSFFIDRVTDFIYAISALVIAFLWINRGKNFVLREVVNLRNVGGFFSLNLMLGLWSLVVLAPAVVYAGLISIFLMPSIARFHQDQSADMPEWLTYFDLASDFIVAYWSILLLPMIYWVLVQAYGRLIFLLELAPRGSDPEIIGNTRE